MKRIALGTPRTGEGHTAVHQKLCLAIIPWAPVPCGEMVVAAYVDEVKKRAGASYAKIRGFRYLVQDQPRGTMLQDKFIEALRWLGRNGFAFDLGVDQHRGGKWQLEEAVEMVERAHEGVEEKDKVTFIINHLCKPDLAIYNTTDPSFIAWRHAMFRLSTSSHTYMKLSGGLTELPATLQMATTRIDDIFLALQPYLAVVLAAFGASRLMFGSDWPVCSTGMSGNDAWSRWYLLVRRLCHLADLSAEDQIMLWSGTPVRAYGITELI